MNAGEPVRLRSKEAANYQCVSRSTLAKWRMRGIGPPFHRCGDRLVYYFKHEIDDWLASCDKRARSAATSRAHYKK